MKQIGREMRPMLSSSWKRPPANGRRGFTLRGFIIGLILGVTILAPAAGLIYSSDTAYAYQQQEGIGLPVPPGLDLPLGTQPEPPRRIAAAGAATTEPGANALRRRVFTVRMRVTAYCPCRKCCGKFADGNTASGKTIWHNDGKFVAAPRWLPFGATVKIPGYHQAQSVPVFDRGKAITGYKLDVFFFDHAQARKWGSRYLDVEITLAE